MSRVKTYLLEGVAASANGIAASQTFTAGVPLTLQGGAATLSPSRRIQFTSAGNLSGIEFTVYGTNAEGNPISESLAGVSSTAPRTTINWYSSVTKITANTTSAVAVVVGWTVGAATPWVLTGRGLGQDQMPICMANAITVSGAPTGNWEATYSGFPNTPEEQISVDSQVAWASGTGVEIQGEGCRFVLTSGAGTSLRVRFARPGPY